MVYKFFPLKVHSYLLHHVPYKVKSELDHMKNKQLALGLITKNFS